MRPFLFLTKHQSKTSLEQPVSKRTLEYTLLINPTNRLLCIALVAVCKTDLTEMKSIRQNRFQAALVVCRFITKIVQHTFW